MPSALVWVAVACGVVVVGGAGWAIYVRHRAPRASRHAAPWPSARVRSALPPVRPVAEPERTPTRNALHRPPTLAALPTPPGDRLPREQRTAGGVFGPDPETTVLPVPPPSRRWVPPSAPGRPDPPTEPVRRVPPV